MSTDLTTLEHYCNVVRRQIEEEYRNLSPVFIIHKTGERDKAIIDKKNVIASKPYGNRVFNTLIQSKKKGAAHSQFWGVIVNKGGFFNLLGKKHYTAILFINSDE